MNQTTLKLPTKLVQGLKRVFLDLRLDIKDRYCHEEISDEEPCGFDLVLEYDDLLVAECAKMFLEEFAEIMKDTEIGDYVI